MTHTSLPIQNAGVLGLGISSRGVLEYLYKTGCTSVTLRSHTQPRLTNLPPFRHMRILQGERVLDELCEPILFLSPSVRREAPTLLHAQARGMQLCSDTELFFSRVRGTTLAITGSDGKSTTTKFTELLLNSGQFSSVRAGGNIGRALCPMLSDDDERCAYAVELSSFQLMYTTPHTTRALITNISENHLNWHTDIQEYIHAKGHIYEKTDASVLNVDDPAVCHINKRAPFAVFSMTKRHPAEWGAQVAVTLGDDAILVNGYRRVKLAHIRAHGVHNIQNLMAAMALCDGLYDPAAAEEVAARFEGLPHRARCIATLRGVRYIDASVDSSPSRTLTTLRAQAAAPILILCGRGKHLCFEELLQELPTGTKALFCAGEFGKQVYDALVSSPYPHPLLYTKTMAEAVYEASRIAEPGDTILLSPAATSFDEFENFEERALVFHQTVERVQQDMENERKSL